jgi:hypothetical protein
MPAQYVPNQPRFEADEFALAPDPTGRRLTGWCADAADEGGPLPTPADPGHKLCVRTPATTQDQVE